MSAALDAVRAVLTDLGIEAGDLTTGTYTDAAAAYRAGEAGGTLEPAQASMRLRRIRARVGIPEKCRAGQAPAEKEAAAQTMHPSGRRRAPQLQLEMPPQTSRIRRNERRHGLATTPIRARRALLGR